MTAKPTCATWMPSAAEAMIARMSDDTQDSGLKIGFHPPEQCARGRSDCQSLAQIISTEGQRTFMCCGEVLNGATPRPQDQWVFCLRGYDGPDSPGTDVRFFVDRRDMSHMAAVLSMGLATVMLPDGQPQ